MLQPRERCLRFPTSSRFWINKQGGARKRNCTSYRLLRDLLMLRSELAAGMVQETEKPLVKAIKARKPVRAAV